MTISESAARSSSEHFLKRKQRKSNKYYTWKLQSKQNKCYIAQNIKQLKYHMVSFSILSRILFKAQHKFI